MNKPNAKQVAYAKAVAAEQAAIQAYAKAKGTADEFAAGTAVINARAVRQMAFIRTL